MSDPDGDSQMRSSSSSSGGDSPSLFPAEHEPPGAIPSSNLSTILSERSGFTPPQSQDLSDAMDTGATQAFAAGESNVAGNSAGNAWVPQSDFAKSAAEINREPGWKWNNKKAKDEYQRAAQAIEDKSFSLKEFGDPFDESQEGQGNGKA